MSKADVEETQLFLYSENTKVRLTSTIDLNLDTTFIYCANVRIYFKVI